MRISAWQHGACLGSSPRGLADYVSVFYFHFASLTFLAFLIISKRWNSYETEKFKLWEEFYDYFSWLFKIFFSFFAPSKHFLCCNEPSGPREVAAPGTPAEILFPEHPVSWPSTSEPASQQQWSNLVIWFQVKYLVEGGIQLVRKQNQTMSKLSWFTTPGRGTRGKLKNIDVDQKTWVSEPYIVFTSCWNSF